MTWDIFISLSGFALATLYTPGPNNLMLMASGANYGLRPTLPHILGVAWGFPAMAAAVGLGLGAAFQALPALRWLLTALSVAFILWLAWKVARAAPPGQATAGGRPLTFLQAAAFQWVNPKAWALAISAMTAYAGDAGAGRVITVAAVFAVYGMGSATLWAAAGTRIRRFLTRPGRLRVFNWTMAALLVASMLPLLTV